MKGNGNGKKKIIPFVANDIVNHCEDNEGNFKVPHRASNSAFSTTVDIEEDDNEKTTLVNQTTMVLLKMNTYLKIRKNLVILNSYIWCF